MNFDGLTDNPLVQQLEGEAIGATTAGIVVTSRSIGIATGLVPRATRIGTGNTAGSGIPIALVAALGIGAAVLFWPKGGK